ncbi:MAG: PilC/PilY family type IV pilus protein [Granulosicoccus sp.]
MLRIKQSLLTSLILTVVTLSPFTLADDTEIFYGQSTDAAVNNPNILFVLDNSGSMRRTDDGQNNTRMERMKQAMNVLLDQSSNFNVGLMGFQGQWAGGAVHYPIGYLESDSGELCDGGICQDEVIVSRPGSSSDDATQISATQQVMLNTNTLIMSEPPSTATSTSTAAAADTSKSISATSSVSEAKNTLTASYINKNNEEKDQWFYHGAAGYEFSRHAYRFDAIDIPAGANVTSASITFSLTDPATQTGNVSAAILAERTIAVEDYPDNGGISVPLLHERNDPQKRTNAFVSWPDINNTPADNKINTPDVSSLLNELIDQNGWTSGSSISILINPLDEGIYIPSASDIREIYGVSAAANLVPVLSYTFSETADPNSTTLVVEAGSHQDEYIEENTGAAHWNFNNTVSSLFHSGTGNRPRELALMFDNIAIPADVVITSAKLQLNSASTTDTGDTDTNWIRDPAAAPAAALTVTIPTAPLTVTPNVSININAELSASPQAFSAASIGARNYTTNFVEWVDVDSTESIVVESPRITDVIAEVLALPGWAQGNSLTLKLSAPADYIDTASNVRRLLTSSSGSKPTLHITWKPANGTGNTASNAQTTGIRFQRVHVPPGATIKSAELIFTSAAADNTATTLNISGEDIANPAAFTDSPNNIGSRQLTTARKIWNVDPWDAVGTEYTSVDLAPIVQEITDRTDWCGGNPMAIFLEGTGTRQAVAYDQNSQSAPALRIIYEPGSVPNGSFCSNNSVVVSVLDGADDAVENLATNAVSTSSIILATNTTASGTGSKQMLGLRFQGVHVPQGASIVSASIELVSQSAFTSSAQLNVRVETTDNAPPYIATSKDISNRNYGTALVWSSAAPIVANQVMFSPDITSLVSSVVNRSGWQPGNAMAFSLEGMNNNTVRTIRSVENGETLSAQLSIYYESQRDAPGTLFRDNLKREINSLVPEGSTPIVTSLYEAARYFRGDTVDYGLQRGIQDWRNRFHRVSHPFSYTGGELYRQSGCVDADLNSYDCISETIYNNGSTATYDSPITSQCQSNHIVLLSDGGATRTNSGGRIESLIGTGCAATGNSSEQCGFELAAWLKDTDHSGSLTEKQNITTHTIAFNLNPDKRAFLSGIANAGGGTFQPAASATDLLTAFRNIFIEVSRTDTSFVAPAASISQSNRTRHRDDLYFSLFKPKSTARWPGNVKRYKAKASSADQSATIVDVNDDPAIDPVSGEFVQGSRSWWSSEDDGDSVLLGGVAEQLESNGVSHTARDVYTYLGSSTDLAGSDTNRLISANAANILPWLNLSPALASNNSYVNELISWTRGMDVFDSDGDGDTSESRGEMGDPMHSQPLLLNYAGGDSVVYIATNEGFLHAIDSETGEENYAFIPRELLKNQQKFYTNAPTRNRPYGLDGGMTAWVDDTDKDGVIDANEDAYLYIAMRRGGNLYYALDVSNPESPKYLWSIQGGTITSDADDTTANGDFTQLADTWSKPVKIKVLMGEDEIDALVFAAGYSPTQDPPATSSTSTTPALATRSKDAIGRGIYIVNAKTGARLWYSSLVNPDFSAMEYSMPSDIRAIDINFDGLPDMMFVGDMGGQVWRFDLNNDRSQSLLLGERITGGRIAELASDTPGEARRFYNPPDVSLINTDDRQQLAISVGSGWRAHPLDTDVQDRFYSIRSRAVYGPPLNSYGVVSYPTLTEGTTGFMDVSNSFGGAGADVSRGWYFDLPDTGEKVLSSSITIDNQIIFTAYQPAVDVGVCAAAIGSSNVYAISAINGDPVTEFSNGGNSDSDSMTHNDRRRSLHMPGMAPAASLLFPEQGKATVMVGTDSVDEIQFGETRKRSFWQEVMLDGDE